MARLTNKQKEFLMLIQKGVKRAEAYKKAYKRDELSNTDASKRASALLKKDSMKLALYGAKNNENWEGITKEKQLKDLIEIRDEAIKHLKDGQWFKNNVDIFKITTEEINKMLGFYAEIELKKEVALEELKLKRERLEFDKSKIKKDNEELEKKNASLLDQLANSIIQRRKNREKEEEISPNVT